MKHRSPAAVRFLIRGRVQGVGYRYFAQAAAQRAQIRGWVRNRSDGTVEVMAIAPEEELNRFEQLLREGPPGARVETIESSPIDASALGSVSGFRVAISVEGEW